MAIVKNAIRAMEATMTVDEIRRAHSLAEGEILAIKLAELRTRRGIKQTDLAAFSQTAVSKLERRKDMKVSTLIEYLDGLGMGMEIRVYPRKGKGKADEETLFRV